MTDAEIKADIRKHITRGDSREDLLIELAFKYAQPFDLTWSNKNAAAEYSKGVFLTATDLWRVSGQ